jgi:hypothetical protein
MSGVTETTSFRINQKVSTPLGDGMIEGPYGDDHWVVRVKITEVSAKALKRSNCLTPQAVISGLWVFEGRDLK